MKNIISISNEHLFRLLGHFLLVALCLCLMACGENIEKDSAIEVTEGFVITYYVADDVRGSLHDTDGKAKKKLEAEFADIVQYASDGDDEQKPDVTYKLLKAEKIEDSVYAVTWDVTDQYAQKINVTISAIHSDEGWRIFDFEEK